MARRVCAASLKLAPVSVMRLDAASTASPIVARILLKVAQEPARSDPLVPAWTSRGDEDREFERVEQTELRQLPCSGYGRKHVATPNRSLEDRVRVALRGRRSSSLGAKTGFLSLEDGLQSAYSLWLREVTQWAEDSEVCEPKWLARVAGSLFSSASA